jgi:carboxylesterase type B
MFRCCISRIHVADSADDRFWTMTFEAGPNEVATNIESETHIEDIWVVFNEANTPINTIYAGRALDVKLISETQLPVIPYSVSAAGWYPYLPWLSSNEYSHPFVSP